MHSHDLIRALEHTGTYSPTRTGQQVVPIALTLRALVAIPALTAA